MCMCVQCVAGHEGKNPENEGLWREVDGVSRGHTGEAHSSPSEWVQWQQKEEGGLSCFVF